MRNLQISNIPPTQEECILVLLIAIKMVTGLTKQIQEHALGDVARTTTRSISFCQDCYCPSFEAKVLPLLLGSSISSVESFW